MNKFINNKQRKNMNVRRKNKQINNKGFTMIELLASITILGIISVVAISSVSALINKSNEKFNQEQEQQLVLATQTYAQNNRNILPKEIGKKKRISLKELQDKKYIKDEVLDSSDGKCDPDTSYVDIFKYSKNDYSYSPTIKCPDYKTDKEQNDKVPKIDIKFVDQNSNEINTNKTSSVKDVFAKVNLKGNEDGNMKLMSYNYTIIVNDVQRYKSGSLRVGYATDKEIVIPLDNYVPGVMKFIITAINIEGNEKTVTKIMDFSDIKSPLCGEVIGQANYKDENGKIVCLDWYNKASAEAHRRIEILCGDEDGSGCARPSFIKVFQIDEDRKDDFIEILDRNNNKVNCPVYVCIDKTYPRITVNVYKRDSAGNKTGGVVYTTTTNQTTPNTTLTMPWLNGTDYPNGIVLEVKADDKFLKELKWEWNNDNLKEKVSDDGYKGGSTTTDLMGLTTKTETHSLSAEGYRRGRFTVVDEADNKSTIKIVAPIDRTKPACAGNDGTTSWTGSPRTVTVKCTDKMSECTNPSFSKTYTTGETRGDNIQIDDKAGNTNSCAVNVYADFVKPTCVSSGGNSTWTNGSRTITGTCSDTGSGCQGNVSKVFSSQIDSNVSPGTVYDKVGNSVMCPADQVVKIDTTKPTCKSSGGSTTWTNGSRTLLGTCYDTGGSGCKGNVTKPYTTTANLNNQTPGTVYDNAGNSVTCPADQPIRIDQEKPTCESGGGSTSWSTKPLTLTGKCTDTGGSGCVEAVIYNEYTGDQDVTGRSPGSVKDNAGNVRKCPANQTVRIDKKAPTCNPTRTATGPDGVSYTFSCDDNLSGVASCAKSQSGLKSSASYTIKDKAGNTASCKVNVTEFTQYSIRTCKTYYSCENSACGAATCTSSCCGTTGGYYNCDECAPGGNIRTCIDVNGGDYWDRNTGLCCRSKTCGTAPKAKSCTSSRCCGYSSCRTSACGCKDWNSWSKYSSTNTCSGKTSCQSQSRLAYR